VEIGNIDSPLGVTGSLLTAIREHCKYIVSLHLFDVSAMLIREQCASYFEQVSDILQNLEISWKSRGEQTPKHLLFTMGGHCEIYNIGLYGETLFGRCCISSVHHLTINMQHYYFLDLSSLSTQIGKNCPNLKTFTIGCVVSIGIGEFWHNLQLIARQCVMLTNVTVYLPYRDSQYQTKKCESAWSQGTLGAVTEIQCYFVPEGFWDELRVAKHITLLKPVL